MKKIKVTLEIETTHKGAKANPFVQIWKTTMASNLRQNYKIKILYLLVLLPTLFYFLSQIMNFVFNLLQIK